MTAPNERDTAESAAPRLFPDRERSAALAEASAIAERAIEEHRPVKTFLLFSGGNDSLVLLDTMWRYADAIVHIDTGIGIPDAHAFAEATAALYDRPYLVYTPPESYRSLVLGRWRGMPGPGMHNIVFQRLKERCIEQLWRDTPHSRRDRYVLLSGIRRAESKRRQQRKEAIERKGPRVYCKPLFHWSNEEMRRYRIDFDLPVNPVSANLHMSGECLCGAMADQDDARSERAAIKFFYPEFDAVLSELEAECRARGYAYDEWGVRRPDGDDDEEVGELCQSCAWRQEKLWEASA